MTSFWAICGTGTPLARRDRAYVAISSSTTLGRRAANQVTSNSSVVFGSKVPRIRIGFDRRRFSPMLLSPVVGWMRWRGWDGGDAGGGLGPDEQDGAGGVVDDEAAGGAEAAGPEVGAVTVASEDEQVGAFGGGHDFPFDAAGALATGARAPQTHRRVGEGG